jgi:hypothetical protein
MLYVTFNTELKLILVGFEGDGHGPFKDIALAFPRRDQRESELLYDWRFTANQFVLATSPLRITIRDFFSTGYWLSYSSFNILSDKKMGPYFTISAGPRQRSFSQVRVSRDS